MSKNAKLLPAVWLISFAGAAGIAFAAVLPLWVAAPEFTPHGSPEFTPHGSMSAARAFHQATVLADGRVLVTGGCSAPGCGVPLASVEIYERAPGGFRQAAALEVARVGHAAVGLYDGRVLVAGGWNGGGAVTAAAELYDPSSDRWRRARDLTGPRGDLTLTALPDGRILAAGGSRDMVPLATTEIYDPRTGTFAPASDMTTPRTAHAAVALKDGRVLVTGGHARRRGAALRSAEIFDPASGRFSPTADMRMPRHKHAAVLLPDGRVMVVGGSDERDARGLYSSTEIYDPATGRFEPGPSMRHGRYKLRDAVVVGPDGSVLVAGGAVQAELYDPRVGAFVPLQRRIGASYAFATTTLLSTGDVLLIGGYDEHIRPTSRVWLGSGFVRQ